MKKEGHMEILKENLKQSGGKLGLGRGFVIQPTFYKENLENLLYVKFINMKNLILMTFIIGLN